MAWFSKEQLESREPGLSGADKIGATPREGADNPDGTPALTVGQQLAVERSVRGVLDRLRELGELGNTCVVLTSDNGSRFGEHSLVMGKNTAYEEDLGTPLYVNGPGVVATAPEEMALNVDLAPTFSEWGGAAFAGDGRSLAPVLRGERVPWRERLMVESWTVEGSRYHEYIPRYEGVRERGRVYVEYPETGERELYHLDADPFRMENRLHEATPEAEAEASALAARLGALKNCAGETCRGAENP